MRVGEDTLFMLDFIKKTNSCAILDRPFYIYNECENLFYSKYKLSIEEAIYSMDKLFQSYDKLGLINKQVEKYIFLDYKLYCYNDVCKRHDLWFNDSTVKKSYNRIKRYLGFNYRLRYFLLSNHIFFRYLMIFRGFIDVKK